MMECDICNRKDVAQIGVHCTVCARTAIYALRIEVARLLLDRESLSRKIELATSEPLLGSALDDIKVLTHSWQSEIRKTKLQAVKERTERQRSEISSAKDTVLKLREDIIQKRARLAQRKTDIETVAQQVPTRRQNIVDKLNKIGNRGMRSFEYINTSSIDTRAFLCREAANLLGMKHQKVKDEAGHVYRRVLIAEHAVPDLRYTHSMSFWME